MDENHYEAEIKFTSDRYTNEFDVQVWLRTLIESHNLPEGFTLGSVNVRIDYSIGEEK